MTDNRIPVTIITGFLGAGKTTLLNRLISKNKGRKLAVIENEFGEINIDSDIVVGVDEGIFELSNGCLCCELNEELVEVLRKLIDTGKKIDHLIVETTGIADPAPVAMSFLSDYQIQKEFRLDAIIALTDVRFIEQQLEDREEACRQIAAADVVVINKTDQADEYQLSTVRNIISRMNSEARILEASFGEVKDTDLLELKAFSREGVLNLNADKARNRYTSLSLSKEETQDQPQRRVFGEERKLQHHSDISSCSFVFPETIDLFRFDIWIRITLNSTAMKLYRVKGILNARNYNEKFIFQAVNNQYMSEKAGVWGDDEQRVSKIVFIGKNLDKHLLTTGLAACSSPEEFDPASFFKAIH